MPRKNAKKTNSSENDGQEFFAAIAQIEKEKGIPAGYMMEKITQALASAYKRDHEGAGDNIEVKANPETGEVRMFILKDIVETVDNPATEMALEEARRAIPHAQLGDVVRIEVKPKNFGRIAAQTARQVIIQGIREAERGMIYDEFSSRSTRSSPAWSPGWTPAAAPPICASAPATSIPKPSWPPASRSGGRRSARVTA